MPEDWMKEDMYSMRTESPFYWEMQETLRDHYREMDQIAADERADILAELDYDEDEEDEDLYDPRNDPRFF